LSVSVAFSEKKFEHSPSIAKYAVTIGEGEKRWGYHSIPWTFKMIKAARIPVYSCVVEAALSGS
jgi:hypothetical protein